MEEPELIIIKTEYDDDLSLEESTEYDYSANGDSTQKLEQQYTKLNQYTKRNILEHVKMYGNDATHRPKLAKKFRCDPLTMRDFINNKAKESQENVHIECDSPSFQSVTTWIEGFKANGFNLTSGYEPALIMKSIGLLENHPPPSECGGVNFKELYVFFGNVMCGNPAIELDEPTRSFLCDTFAELIDDVNSSEGDENLLKLRNELQLNPILNAVKENPSNLQASKIGLNPLQINDFNIE